MRKIASTFITGLQDVVKDMLNDSLPDASILLLLDGLVIYETNASIRELERLPFFVNSFLVQQIFENLHRHPINEMANALARDGRLANEVRAMIRGTEIGRTFRVMALDRNQHVSFSEKLRRTIERKLSSIKGLRVDRGRPDTEFWLLYRDEGYGFFLMRLTSHKAYEELLERGELKPELAYTLCYLSEPKAEDIVLDPFCGYGSIPLQRALHFPFNMIFASDKDPDMKRLVRQKAKDVNTKGLLIAKSQDALRLSAFEDNFIHKIVTDPPWGFFEELDRDIDEFYSLMIKELYRVLSPGGIMVILTARKEALTRALSHFSEKLTLLNHYDILVSGKKAAIYKIKKAS
jgi:tRNA (guanine6-N2)-methyltransferase